MQLRSTHGANAYICIFSAYLCIIFFIFMHNYAYAYFGIYAYFRNAYSVLYISLFHLCIFCIYSAIWYCIFLHILKCLFLHLDAYYACICIFWADNRYWEHTTGCEAGDDEALAWEFLRVFAGKIAAEATRLWLGCGEDSQEQRGAELILQMYNVVDCAGSLGPCVKLQLLTWRICIMPSWSTYLAITFARQISGMDRNKEKNNTPSSWQLPKLENLAAKPFEADDILEAPESFDENEINWFNANVE